MAALTAAVVGAVLPSPAGRGVEGEGSPGLGQETFGHALGHARGAPQGAHSGRLL